MREIKRKISLREFKSFEEGILYGEFVEPNMYIKIDLKQSADDMGIFTDLDFLPFGDTCGGFDANLFINDITCFEGPPSSAPAIGSMYVVANGGTEPYTYLWSTGADVDTISGLNSGTYSVVVTDIHGCHVELEGTIEVSSSADGSITVTLTQDVGNILQDVVTPVTTNTPDPIILCPSETATLTALPGYQTYVWEDEFGNNVGNTQSLVIDGLEGTFHVSVEDAYGCTGESMTVTIEYAVEPPLIIEPLNLPPDVVGSGTYEDPWIICNPNTTEQPLIEFGVTEPNYFIGYKWSGTLYSGGAIAQQSGTNCSTSAPCEIYVEATSICDLNPPYTVLQSNQFWIAYSITPPCEEVL